MPLNNFALQFFISVFVSVAVPVANIAIAPPFSASQSSIVQAESSASASRPTRIAAPSFPLTKPPLSVSFSSVSLLVKLSFMMNMRSPFLPASSISVSLPFFPFIVIGPLMLIVPLLSASSVACILPFMVIGSAPATLTTSFSAFHALSGYLTLSTMRISLPLASASQYSILPPLNVCGVTVNLV